MAEAARLRGEAEEAAREAARLAQEQERLASEVETAKNAVEIARQAKLTLPGLEAVAHQREQIRERSDLLALEQKALAEA